MTHRFRALGCPLWLPGSPGWAHLENPSLMVWDVPPGYLAPLLGSLENTSSRSGVSMTPVCYAVSEEPGVQTQALQSLAGGRDCDTQARRPGS